ncbi:mechanosensitive ion channel family protein [Tautonia rosea]|uniref:mechanosensitive ion channel family protein n=1 Tax=Tautonia rosea TaxID=2728037 RepID=UPI0014765FD1|nr:mechanosensitive ion channel family protein [Tautonia rosea]
MATSSPLRSALTGLPRGIAPWVLLALVVPIGSAPAQEELLAPLVGQEAEAPPTAPDADEGTVAEAEGPIAIEQVVTDEQIEEKLRSLLPRYPGVRSVEVSVDQGVVTLTGHVEDSDVQDRVRDFVRRVEGVTLVLNQTRTDSQVLTAGQLLVKRLGRFWNLVSQTWLAFLTAVAVLIGSILVAKLFSESSERLLAPLFESLLLRSVVASVAAVGIVMIGVYAALEVMGVARAVLSVVGLAGAVALALSFAFRDFAENFIASLLLGVRQPFRVGDFVEVAGHSGVVRALTTRATILVTLEGHQVRIPNATVFKNVIINRTASDAVLQSFDVVIGYDASAVEAQRAIAASLSEHDGILDDPRPRTLVEALERDGVRLRSFFWLPTRGIDGAKILSDARLKAKVALQRAGITPTPTSVSLSLSDRINVALASSEGDGVLPNGDSLPHPRAATVPPDRARSNLELDSAVAESSSASEDAQPDPIDQALHVAQDVVGDEQDNILSPDRRSRKAADEATPPNTPPQDDRAS